jgi:hypothetical protein
VFQEVWINQHCPATVDGTKSQQATVPNNAGWEGEESRQPSVRILGRQKKEPLSRERRKK